LTTVTTDETFSVRLPQPIAAEVRHIARAEGNGASSVICRLLTRALQFERNTSDADQRPS
jgi:hypothetical protein